MPIVIEPAPAPTPEVVALIAELDRDLDATYPREQRHGLRLEQLFRPNIRFFVARLDGRPVGCGGVALFDEYAEVKRMYTREAARGRGVGRTLLAQLEAAARDAGHRVLCLETGVHQAPAIGLYEGFGFRRRGPFGHYAELPPHRIAASIFYEKPL